MADARRDARVYSYENNAGKKRHGFVLDTAPVGMPRKQVRKQGFTTKAAAIAARDELVAEIVGGMLVDPTRILFGEYLLEWLEVRQRVLRPTTKVRYMRDIQNMVLTDPIAAMRLQVVSVRDINSFIGRLQATERRDGRGLLSSTSIRHCIGVVRTALQDAVKQSLIKHNPVDNATRPKKVKRRKKDKPRWTKAQAKQFLDSIHGSFYELLWRLLLLTGVRIGEGLGLQWGDVDLDAGVVEIKRTICRLNGELLVQDPKTEAGERSFRLDQRTVALFRRHREKEDAVLASFGRSIRDTDWVFADGAGLPFQYTRIRKAWHSARENAGLPHLSPHGARHSHGSLLHDMGVPIKEISERLGHADAWFTLQNYIHSDDDAPDHGQALDEVIEASGGSTLDQDPPGSPTVDGKATSEGPDDRS